jgi:hypothetical protein
MLPIESRREGDIMRALLTATSLIFVLFCTSAAFAQQCPAPGDHWCGPGRGCCPAGETCAPKNGCLGGTRNGPACGSGRCQEGYHCINDGGVARCALN